MIIVALAWMFVVVLMAAAEATSSQGSVLGAFFTLLLYGFLPLSIVLYVMATPTRRRLRRDAEAAADTATATQATTPSGPQADSGGQSPGAGLAPERKEP